MKSFPEEILCYCTGDTVKDVCRVASAPAGAAGTIGNYCTGCRDDFKLLCAAVQEDPLCTESEEALRRAIERVAKEAAAPRSA